VLESHAQEANVRGVEARVRRATVDDAATIAAIHAETWRAAYAHAFPADYLEGLSVHHRRELWKRTLAGGTFDVFVAQLEDAAAGFVSSGPAEDDSAPGELFALYVLPAAWGKGLGRALLRCAEQALRERGYESAALWMLEDNRPARRLYETAGWTADGGRKSLAAGGAEAAVVRYRKGLA
jgi:ribosomal protein S18 acetylase RimI-like enzyme